MPLHDIQVGVWLVSAQQAQSEIFCPDAINSERLTGQIRHVFSLSNAQESGFFSKTMQTATRPIFQWPPYVKFLRTEQLISRPLWLASYKPISRHWSTITEKVWKITFTTTIHTEGDLKQILRCTMSAIPEKNFK
jgi:hypothetical protein